MAFDAFVVKHVADSVDHEANFLQVGKIYFPESLVPLVYGSMSRRRKPFMDLLWTFTHVVIGKLLVTGVNTLALFARLSLWIIS